jgi:quercetin dioxygenase-like cupin family protein
MKMIESEGKPWAEKQGYSKKVLLDEKDLREFGSLVQEIKIKSGETAKEHYHKKQTEVFYFSDNNGYWVINGEKVFPNAGDVLIVEPLDKHAVINNSLKDYIYLAIKFNYSLNDSYWK